VTRAYRFEHREQGGFPVQRGALGDCDLSVMHIGGEWQWLVRRAGRDVAEGAARSADDAQRKPRPWRACHGWPRRLSVRVIPATLAAGGHADRPHKTVKSERLVEAIQSGRAYPPGSV
jgi:hypothetical protein